MTEGTSGGMIIQEYAEDVLQGKYSLTFISCSHSHTILRTLRMANSDVKRDLVDLHRSWRRRMCL